MIKNLYFIIKFFDKIYCINVVKHSSSKSEALEFVFLSLIFTLKTNLVIRNITKRNIDEPPNIILR